MKGKIICVLCLSAIASTTGALFGCHTGQTDIGETLFRSNVESITNEEVRIDSLPDDNCPDGKSDDNCPDYGCPNDKCPDGR